MHMTLAADFAGTWYFRGDRKVPCYIRLRGATLEITDEERNTYPVRTEGTDVIIVQVPWRGMKGELSTDKRRIAWNNGEIWER